MSRGRVLVTGASSGIGAATVAALVRRGFDVLATVRSQADEEALVAGHGARVAVARCDITDAEQVAALGGLVAGTRLQGLVDNAGLAVAGPLEFLPLAELRHQLEVNVVGQLAVTQAVLPALRAARGRIVVMGSIADRVAGPMLGAYHASKFALLGLTDTLRAELAPVGVTVVLVEPGAIATPIWRTSTERGEALVAGMPGAATEIYGKQIRRTVAGAKRTAERGLPASAVAEVVADALTVRRPRPRYLVGRDAHVAAMIARLPHRLRYRLTAARS